MTKQHQHNPPGLLSASSSFVSLTGPGSSSNYCCQGELRRNRYLCLLSGHVELSRPCLRGLGGAPWPIILFSPFCLSHKDIYTTRYFHWVCFTYTLTAYFPFVSEFLDMKGLQLQVCEHIPYVYTQRNTNKINDNINTNQYIWTLVFMCNPNEVRRICSETRFQTIKPLNLDE